MKITKSLVNKLIQLKNGELIPASSLRGDRVEQWLNEGILFSRSQGRKRMLLAPNPTRLEDSLAHYEERFRDLELLKQILENDSSRSEQTAETGNSKYSKKRFCPGFLINSYEPLTCQLNGKPFKVQPPEGCYLFITDWQTFSVPDDVIIVGIENMENFRHIRKQQALFESQICRTSPLLFVSRYPQSADLREWLQHIPNRYVHFGDFDLAGIQIFLTEFHAYIPERAAFLIPADIEDRLAAGSRERYTDQYPHFSKLSTTLPYLQELINKIHHFHRGYDQEGYITRTVQE